MSKGMNNDDVGDRARVTTDEESEWCARGGCSCYRSARS